MKTLLYLALLLVLGVSSVQAGELITSYTARLSRKDHFSSTGERLTTPAAVIRQDRANFHKFGRADSEDEGDGYFGEERHRALLERALDHGHTSRSAYRAIVNGTPLISVSVYRDGDEVYIDVKILEE